MADKYTEARLENWARANRESYRYTKSATAVFCDSLRYYYGMPKDSEEAVPAMPEIKTIDLNDANKLDKAYQSNLLPKVFKSLLRMFYINRIHPRSIEKRLSLGDRSFYRCKERAIKALMAIVITNDEMAQKIERLDKMNTSVGCVTDSKE